MRVAIYTLGCKVNQYETQAMEQELLRRGHTLVPAETEADGYIVNTCSVTAISDKKSRQMIRRCHKLNPNAVVAACGCYVQTHPEVVAALDVDLLAGTGDRMAFLDLFEQAAHEKEPVRLLDDALRRREFEVLPAGGMAERTRAMLKVEDGCVNFCTYCIIPYTRGRLRSLPLDAAAAETARIDAEGYREIVLTGIEVASYGVDLPGKPGLADVIETVASAAPDMRIRLGSLEPTVITEDFCRRLAATGRLCRHFHLSLQSGCDRTLKAMNRKYDTAGFYRAVELLREYFPGCALTADLICGFPGETEEDHAATLEFIRKCGFADMHIFPYSRRPGTPADKMPCQCENAVKSRRAHEAQKVSDEMHRDFTRGSIGQTLPVLFETEHDGVWTGHSDTYILVKARGEALRGKICPVSIKLAQDEALFGEII